MAAAAGAENDPLQTETRARAFQFVGEQGYMKNLGPGSMRLNKATRESLKLSNAKATYGNFDKPRIYAAVRSHNLDHLRELVANGADIEARYFDFTPLMWAVLEGEPELVSELCRLGADVNAVEFPESTRRPGRFPLYFAVEHGMFEIVNRLLNCGADITLGAGKGDSVLDVAAMKGDRRMIDLLLSKGAGSIIDVVNPIHRVTPLQNCIFEGNLGCVKSLVAAGADLSIPSPAGLTALGLARDRLEYVLDLQERYRRRGASAPIAADLTEMQERRRGRNAYLEIAAEKVQKAQEVLEFLEDVSQNQTGGRKKKLQQKKKRATRKRIRSSKR